MQPATRACELLVEGYPMWRWIFFVFFSNQKIYSKIYPSFYCKLVLQRIFIGGFQKLFAYKVCLPICVNCHFAGMNLSGSIFAFKSV